MRFYDVTSWSYVNLDDPISIVVRPLQIKVYVHGGGGVVPTKKLNSTQVC